jgi:hypothetical protein
VSGTVLDVKAQPGVKNQNISQLTHRSITMDKGHSAGAGLRDVLVGQASALWLLDYEVGRGCQRRGVSIGKMGSGPLWGQDIQNESTSILW